METRVARFFLGTTYQNREKYTIPTTIKYTKWIESIQNGKNRSYGHKLYQHRPWLDSPKFTQIGIFGMKIYHLATLMETFRGNPETMDFAENWRQI
jgi:hypothetical protein